MVTGTPAVTWEGALMEIVPPDAVTIIKSCGEGDDEALLSPL